MNASLEVTVDGVGLYGGGPSNPASIPTQSQNVHSPKRNHQDQMGNHSPYQTVNPNDRRKKRKADVWNFFTEEDGHAICRCSKVYKYTSLNGTSTLRNHAIRCPMCADFPGNETNGVVPDKAPKAPRLSTSYSRSMEGRFSASNDGLNEQTPFISPHALANPLPGGYPNFMERHTTNHLTRKPSLNLQLKTGRSLIEWMFTENLSLNILDHPSFHNFMISMKNEVSLLTKDHLFNEMKKYLESLQSIIYSKISTLFPPITVSSFEENNPGHWLQNQNKCNIMVRKVSFSPTNGSSYLAFMISYIDENWLLQSFLLSLVPIPLMNGVTFTTEKLFTLISHEIDKFSLLPYIHTIQFDIGPGLFHVQSQLKQMLSEKKKSWIFSILQQLHVNRQQRQSSTTQTIPSFQLDPMILDEAIKCPIPFTSFLDAMADDLITILSPTFLKPLCSIIHIFHYSRHYGDLHQRLLATLQSKFPQLLGTSRPSLPSIYRDFDDLNGIINAEINLNSFCSFNYDGWEGVYHCISQFFQFARAYQTVLQQLLQEGHDILNNKLPSLFNSLLELFPESRAFSPSPSEGNPSSKTKESLWTELYQLLDWCYHTKHNDLEVFKPNFEEKKDQERAEGGYFIAINHLTFTNILSFQQSLDDLIKKYVSLPSFSSNNSNYQSVLTEVIKFQKKYHNFLSLYNSVDKSLLRNTNDGLPLSSSSSYEVSRAGNGEQTFVPQSHILAPSFSSPSSLPPQSFDLDVYYMSHILDPRFRLSFLQEIVNNRVSDAPHHQGYDFYQKMFGEIYLRYYERYRGFQNIDRTGRDLGLSRFGERSGRMMIGDEGISDSSSISSNSDDEMKFDVERANSSNRGELSYQRANNRDNRRNPLLEGNQGASSNSFGQNLALAWVKKKAITLKYQQQSFNPADYVFSRPQNLSAATISADSTGFPLLPPSTTADFRGGAEVAITSSKDNSRTSNNTEGKRSIRSPILLV